MEYLKPSLEPLGPVQAIVLGTSSASVPDNTISDIEPRMKADDIPGGLDD